jgi:hypothetical protein
VWASEQGDKFVVVSSDRFHALPWDDVRPLVVPVIRARFGEDERPWLVPTSEADPVSGSVVTVGITVAEPGGKRVGMLAGVTMAGVQDGLRALLDL